MFYDINRMRRAVQSEVSEKRYRHCIAVQKKAVELSKIHGGDWYKAAVAGLLHDICREMPLEAQLNYLRRCGILLDTQILENPPIWHGLCGAEYIRAELGVKDSEILDSIRYHTTGRAAMTTLEKVVYIADLTSEDRDFPDVDYVRKLGEENLDEAMAYSLSYSITKVVSRKCPIVLDTFEAYNYYTLNS